MLDNNKKYNLNLSYVRIISTFAIMLVHVVGSVTNIYIGNKQDIYLRNIAQDIGHIFLTIFFMITGYLLLQENKLYSIEQINRKCLKRAVLPLIIFGIPYSLLEIYYENKTINILKAIIFVVEGKSWAHMWYLYVLIGIYLIIPILKVICDKSSSETIKYFMNILFIMNFVIPTINYWLPINIHFEFSIGYVILYVLYGHYIQKYKPKVNVLNYLIIVFAFIILFIYQEENMIGRLTTYNSVAFFLVASSLFKILMNVKFKELRTIKKVDRLCFCVYLIHPFFINLIVKYFDFVPTKSNNSMIMFIILYIIVSILSFITSYILSFVNILKNILY